MYTKAHLKRNRKKITKKFEYPKSQDEIKRLCSPHSQHTTKQDKQKTNDKELSKSTSSEQKIRYETDISHYIDTVKRRRKRKRTTTNTSIKSFKLNRTYTQNTYPNHTQNFY